MDVFFFLQNINIDQLKFIKLETGFKKKDQGTEYFFKAKSF